jgi:LmbE family N-acetylglucosaminyl deacetylase
VTDPTSTPPDADLFVDDHLPAGVLAVAAHPDDLDFGCAGTLARFAKAGVPVTYAIVTSGEAGAPEDMNREEVAVLRRNEQTAAAAAIGVTDVRFLGVPDGRVVADLELRGRISAVIREVRPELVICPSPERRYDRIYASHPDHLATGDATLAAVYPDARNPHAHAELLTAGLEPHAVARTWVTGLSGGARVVDITDVIDLKVAALSCHASQVAKFNPRELLSNWALDQAKALGLPEGRMIEVFYEVNTA